MWTNKTIEHEAHGIGVKIKINEKFGNNRYIQRDLAKSNVSYRSSSMTHLNSLAYPEKGRLAKMVMLNRQGKASKVLLFLIDLVFPTKPVRVLFRREQEFKGYLHYAFRAPFYGNQF